MLSEDVPSLVTDERECPVRRELTLLAAGLDTRFLDAGTTLSEAVTMIDRIIAGLDRVIAALDERVAGAAVADLLAVADMLTGLPAAQKARSARMAEVAGTAAQLRDHVLDMHQILRVLSIYGMNIKIAASGEQRFIGFVDGMNAKLAAGEQQLAGVLGRLKDLDGGLADGQQVDRLLAAECVKVVPDVPRQLALDAAGLTSHLKGVSDLAQRVGAIARSVQGKVAVLLGALQVGDSTRQRLEHVVSMLRMAQVRGCGAAATAHIDRLAAAQLQAIVTDFGRETGALIASLEELVPDAQGLGALIAEQAGNGGHAFLARLEESVSGIERVMVQLRSAQTQASAMTQLAADTVIDLTEHVRRLGGIRIDVQDIATNTRLLCRRHGNVGRAVSVVATEVDGHARRLGVTTDMVATSIDRLGQIGIASPAGAAANGGAGDAIGSALALIRQAYRETERVVLEGGDDTVRLVELLDRTAMRLSQELAVAGAMTDAATALDRRSRAAATITEADDEALRELLPAIASLYTMAREREVHAPYLLPGMEVSGVVPPGDQDDDDDDGLF